MEMPGHQILVQRSGVKAPGMPKEQFKGIHDVVIDQGFAMHIGRFQTRSAIWKISGVRESVH